MYCPEVRIERVTGLWFRGLGCSGVYCIQVYGLRVLRFGGFGLIIGLEFFFLKIVRGCMIA